MFGEENIYNSSVWKRRIHKFQCLEEGKIENGNS